MADDKMGAGAMTEEEKRKKREAAAVVMRDGAMRTAGGAGQSGGSNRMLTWLGALLLAGLVILTGIAASQPDYLPGLFGIDRPVQVVTKHWDNSVVYPIDGVDKAGHKASFDFIIKTQDVSWVRGATDQIAVSDKPVAAGDLGNLLFGPAVQKGLAPSADLIAVGLASEEGQVAGEASRAEQRGKNSATWIGTTIGSGKHIWILNLGQFKSACSEQREKDTSWQRPYLLIGVRSQDAGVNLGQALANAMNGKTNLPSTDCYSNYQLGKVS